MECKWAVPWEEEASVEFLIFDEKEMTWDFKHRYRKEDGHKAKMINVVNLLVRYMEGIVSEISLSMHIVIPERLGKRYAWGADISPGAKTYFEFVYDKKEDEFILGEIIKGARTRLDLRSEGLIKQFEFPFPVPDRIVPEDGTYSVPYLKMDDTVSNFKFSKSVRRFEQLYSKDGSFDTEEESNGI